MMKEEGIGNEGKWDYAVEINEGGDIEKGLQEENNDKEKPKMDVKDYRRPKYVKIQEED
jgi:hypothetical protein